MATPFARHPALDYGQLLNLLLMLVGGLLAWLLWLARSS